MTDSRYPGQLDDDVVLPRVDDNITEIGGEAVNGLRSAVFALERCLGINPQGDQADLATRLNVSLNPDGTIKASALSSVFVTLPIVDDMVAPRPGHPWEPPAGIKEEKLALHHGTIQLKAWIDSLWAFAYALSDAVNQDISNLTQHVAHPSAYGRHRTSDIDGYEGHYSSYNLQGIVTDLDDRIADHVGKTVGAHAASAISFNDAKVDFVANNVQKALEELDNLQMSAVRDHQRSEHSNGIIKTQNVFRDGTDHSYAIVGPMSVDSVGAGNNFVTFSSLPPELAQVLRDDRIDVTVGGNTYRYYVDRVRTSSGVVYFWGTLPASGTATAVVYRTSEELSEPAALMLTIRQENNTPFRSIIQMIHPDAPYILGSGLDLRKLSGSHANVKFGWPGGSTTPINVYAEMQNYPGPATPSSAWTVENLAIVLNGVFARYSPPNRYPLVAFAYRGEIGIACDEPLDYIRALACSNDAWTALGFSGIEKGYKLGPRRIYLDGYEFSSVRLMTEAHGQTEGGVDVVNLDKNLITAGVPIMGVMRVDSSAHADSGTYSYWTRSTDSITTDGYVFSDLQAATIKVYADVFSVESPPDGYRTLYELFIDGYEHQQADLHGTVRVTYTPGPTPSGNPDRWFDITDVSRTFAACHRRININSNVATFGQRGPGKSVINPGPPINLPAPGAHNSAIGFRFRLYDGYGVDYIELEVADGSYIGAVEDSVDVVVYDRSSERHHVQTGVVLHDTVRFKHLSDRRLFGTVGRKDVRSDYTRDYVTYPTSLLRGNGVIYGMGVRQSSVGSAFVSMDGGQVLVNGCIYTLAAQNLQIPPDSAVKIYNLFVDDTGVLRLLEDDGLNSGRPTPSTAEIVASSDKVILARIRASAGNVVDTNGIGDMRRFVHNLDSKIELVIGDAVTGSFASLLAATEYITRSGDATLTNIIRIKGTVTHDVSLGLIALPPGTILEGDSSGQGNYSAGSAIKLVNNGLGSNAILMALGNGCTVRNLTFTMASGQNITDIMVANGPSVDGVVFEQCVFDNINTSGPNINILSADYVTNVRFQDCTFIFTTTTANCAILNLVGLLLSSSEVKIDKCRFYFSSLSGISAVVQLIGAGGLNVSNITNSIINYPAVTTGTCTLVLGAWLNDCQIRNCCLMAPSLAATNLGTYVLSMERTTISECLFSNIGFGVTVGPIFFLPALDCRENTIKDNVFMNTGLPVGLLNPQNSKISGNVVLNSTPTAAMIYLAKSTALPTDIAPSRIDVNDNVFISTSSGAPDGYMIHISGPGDFLPINGVKIKNNFMINNADPLVARGIKKAIVIETPSVAPVIEDNFITDFKDLFTAPGEPSEAILLKGCQNPRVVNNTVLASRHPLHLYDCSNATVTGNYLQTGRAASLSYSAGGPCLLIDGSTTAPGIEGPFCLPAPQPMTVTNNVFDMFNVEIPPVYDSMPSEMVQITNQVAAFGKISDNVFLLQANPLFATHPALSVAPRCYTVTGNTLYASGGPFIINPFPPPTLLPYFPVTFTVAPFTITGDNAFVMGNNVENCAILGPASKLAVTGNASVEILNKGGTYQVILPISQATEERSAAGVSSWKMQVNTFTAFDGTYNIDYTNINFWFGTDYIPAGAQIVKLEIGYAILDGGDTSTLQMRWAANNFATTVDLRALAPVHAVGSNIETITPTSPAFMQQGWMHFLEILLVNRPPTPWIAAIGDMRVTYVL